MQRAYGAGSVSRVIDAIVRHGLVTYAGMTWARLVHLQRQLRLLHGRCLEQDRSVGAG